MYKESIESSNKYVLNDILHGIKNSVKYVSKKALIQYLKMY